MHIQANVRNVCGYDLSYLEAGTGQTVLFLHGFAVSSEYWRPTLSLLADCGYHAVALDILGFGNSEKSDTAPYSLHLYADLAIGLLDALGVEQAAIVGHSFGGKLAIATTILFPQRISHLVAMDNDGFLRAPSQLMRKAMSYSAVSETVLWLIGQEPVIRKQLEMSFYQPEHYITTDMVKRGRDALLLPENRRVLKQMSRNAEKIDLSGSGMRARLHEIDCPTLVIWGEQDRVFPLVCAEAARREIPAAQVVTFPHCGHFPHVESARAFHGLLLGFLASNGKSMSRRKGRLV